MVGYSTMVRGGHTFIRVVLFWMVLLEPVIERGWALKNGDCLRADSAPYFQLTPGGYDPAKGMDGARCQTLCASISAPYSGVQSKKYCLCSDDPFAERLTATKKDVCDKGEQMSTLFFHSDLFSPIEGLRVMPSSSVVNVGEEVVFHLAFKSGKNATVAFNFGDGLPGTKGTLSTEPRYIYWKPGTYSIVVQATPVGASDVSCVSGHWIATFYLHEIRKTLRRLRRQVLTYANSRLCIFVCDVPQLFTAKAETMVVVTTAPEEDTVSWTCPSLVEPGTRFTCHLSVAAGADMTVDVDPGDGSKRQNMKLLRPTCQGCTFLGNNVSCLDGNSLCSQEANCLRSDQCPKRNVYSIYKMIDTVSVMVNKGYFIQRLATPLPVVSGKFNRAARYLTARDILGFTTSGGRLAYRRTLDGESSDLIKRNLLKGQAVRTDDLLSVDRRFLVSALVYAPINLTYDYLYTDPGAYEFRLSLTNKHHDTNVRKMADVSSQEKLTSFRLEVSRNQVPTGTEVEIAARMFGGSDVTMVWNFGDGHTTKEVVKSVLAGQRFVKQHIFKDPGTYVVQVNSSNLHGNFVARRSVAVQRPVTEAWELFTNSPVILPDAVYVTLTYPKTEKLPTDAVARISFGDRQKAKWKVPSESAEKVSQKFSHVYVKPGHYNVAINISNLISSYVLNAKVETATRTTGLLAKVQFQPSDIAPLRVGLGPTNDIFPTTRPIVFTVKTATGIVEQFIIETAKGQLLANGTGKQLKYTLNFPESGQHDVFVYAWNHVQQRTEPFLVSFRSMEPIQGLDVYMNETTPKDEHIRNFLVSFELVGTDTCMMVDYGDETPKRAYGSRSQCFTRYRPDQFQHEGELENPMWLQNIYERGFDYVFTLVAFNDISEQSTSFNITVNNEPCKPPIIKIRNQVLDPVNATIFYRYSLREAWKDAYYYQTIADPLTRAGGIFDPRGRTGDLFVNFSRYSDFRFVSEFEILIGFPARSIFPSHFFFYLAPRAKPPMFHKRFAETYIEMKPSPLLPQMSNGAQSRVTRGFPQTLILNPANYSINPDDPTDKNFSVTWFCRRVPHENINRTVPNEEQNVTVPLYHRLDHLDNITAKGHDFDVAGFLAAEDMEDKGGCFGTGPGLVNISGGSLEWSTIVFYKPNVTYEILAKLEKSDRPPSWGAIQLVLMEKVPPSISVQCQTEKLCYPNDPIGQKINPVRVGLIGLCIENCDGEMVYSWEVFGSDNLTEVYLEDARDYLVGATEQKMALSDDFFKVYYPTFGDFVARLTVTNQWGVSGVSDLFLHINKPPENGQCTFEPNEGRALMDKFKASCSDWTDPEGLDIEFFAFWDDVYQGPRTYLPTRQEFERYLGERSLDNADAAGDQARMNQMSQAIASLMNVRLPDEMENEINYSGAYISNPELVLDREMEAQALLRSKMVRSVSSIMNVDTLSSLEQVGSALTAIAGDGSGVDNEG
ncbi:unnamed protein product, partial [Ixodes hexagonus]